MKSIVILTGSELRHDFFTCKFDQNPKINVLAMFLEGTEQSLSERINSDPESTPDQITHAQKRWLSERTFFASYVERHPVSSPKFHIEKGQINSEEIVNKIVDLKPDILVCYGASIIKSGLINLFKGRFLNVHLGLSPFYRGSGTNVWALINEEPQMVGATFMQIDEGIDTGEIIHQISARILPDDDPHDIGNRLIEDMVSKYEEIVVKFDQLDPQVQPKQKGKLFQRKDFDSSACRLLYQKFDGGLIQRFLENQSDFLSPKLVENKILEEPR